MTKSLRSLLPCLLGLHLAGCNAPDGVAPRLTLTDSITHGDLGSIDGVTPNRRFRGLNLIPRNRRML